jgi:hypothetical protein
MGWAGRVESGVGGGRKMGKQLCDGGDDGGDEDEDDDVWSVHSCVLASTTWFHVTPAGECERRAKC